MIFLKDNNQLWKHGHDRIHQRKRIKCSSTFDRINIELHIDSDQRAALRTVFYAD